ncbi:FAD-binding oxidoreductase [Mesorhizobium amorphae]|uniref:FAD-binding oxidoreductase n=1 Tax=Mesorhizobium amorphae TaxID=71433 RepID=UPI0021B4D457|nr:FAD-binding oxidoreductase [Mesorhizobium amorphae]
MDTTKLIEELRRTLGAAGVLTGTEIGERYRSDASLSGTSLPLAVLRPDTVETISAALRLCNEARQPVVPQGGLTGLAGGANAAANHIAISLERFSGIEEIDVVSATMTVRAGTVLQVAQQAAADAGLLLPIDLGARGSCQLGGVISTNAGGVRVLRYGPARDSVLGLEAVLADGTVVSSMNKMIKNNTGYDLRQLFIGAEGTLGIVTRAVLRLRPLPAARRTALGATGSYAQVLALLARARLELPDLSSFEVMWRDYVRFNEVAAGVRHFAEDHEFQVIVECEGDGSERFTETFDSFFASCLEEGVLSDALIAQSEKHRLDFWAVREGHEMDRLLPNLVNLDVSMEIGALGEFADNCAAALIDRFPDAYVSFFGHLGDGNLHIAVSVPGTDEDGIAAISRIAYELVRDRQGSISAEHGIGTLKRNYLGYSRSLSELNMMRRIKNALDPNGILNPGKVL